jgi:hypothetical protein
MRLECVTHRCLRTFLKVSQKVEVSGKAQTEHTENDLQETTVNSVRQENNTEGWASFTGHRYQRALQPTSKIKADSASINLCSVTKVYRTGLPLQCLSVTYLIQCGLGTFSQRVKHWGMRLTTHLYLVVRSRTVKLCLHSPIRLHGVEHN